jgi:hypothetical protein
LELAQEPDPQESVMTNNQSPNTQFPTFSTSNAMKRIVILLLLICLAKLAGAQVPGPISHQRLLTLTAGTLATDNRIANTGTDGVSPAAIKALLACTQQLQAENQSLRGEVAALRARGQAGNSSIRQARKESTAKVMFVVCLVAGLLLVALVSGQVFPREAYASRFNLNNQ